MQILFATTNRVGLGTNPLDVSASRFYPDPDVSKRQVEDGSKEPAGYNRTSAVSRRWLKSGESRASFSECCR